MNLPKASPRLGHMIRIAVAASLIGMTNNVLGGHPLRAADGGDNGVRLLDVNADGYMDAIVANGQVRQTRIWSPSTGQWPENTMANTSRSLSSGTSSRSSRAGPS